MLLVQPPSQQMDRLSPNQPIRVKKKPLEKQPLGTPKKLPTKLKAIMLLKWDDSTRQFKFAVDLLKYKTLFRTGPAAYIIYVYHKSDANQQYFHRIQNDKNIPLLDTNLGRGLYIWNDPIYVEHKNIMLYQLQCVLGEQSHKQFERQKINDLGSPTLLDGDSMLLAVTRILGSQIIFIVNNDTDLAIEQMNTIWPTVDKQDNLWKVMNIVDGNNQVDIRNWLEDFNDIMISTFNVGNSEHMQLQLIECLNEWQQDLQMALQKKSYQTVDIDFLTFVSLLQVVSKTDVREFEHPDVVGVIYNKAIIRQVSMGKKDCMDFFTANIREYCSNSESRNQMQVLHFLNSLRLRSLSQFYSQMYQFRQTVVYGQQFNELTMMIQQQEEQYCEHDQEMGYLLQKHFSNPKRELDEIYAGFMSDLYLMREFRGIKYQHLLQHMTVTFPQKLRKRIIDVETEVLAEIEKNSKTINQQRHEMLITRQNNGRHAIEILTEYNRILRSDVSSLQKLIEIHRVINKDLEVLNELHMMDDLIIRLKFEIDKRESNK